MSSTTVNLQSLITTAKASGELSGPSLAAIDVPDVGAAIQAAMGVSVDDVDASETVIVSLLMDDSGSIRFGKNADLVRQGHNLMLDALTGTKQRDSILAYCRYLNGTVLYPYTPVVDAVRMDSSNYDPMGGTPLFDETVTLCATVLAKWQEFRQARVTCRTISAIIADGNDEGSYRQNAGTCRALITDMLAKSERNIIAGMGIDDAPLSCRDCGNTKLRETAVSVKACPQCGSAFHRTDFKKVFSDMGIPDQWILTPQNSPSEIRKAFLMLSQSAVRASQGATGFSQTAAGGFAAP